MKAWPGLSAGLLFLAFVHGGIGQSMLPIEHPAGACGVPFLVHGAGWDVCWQQDDVRAQGIEINRAFFHGRQVVWKIGLPLSITNYDADVYGPFKDVLGRPGAGGHPGFGFGSIRLGPNECPRFLEKGVRLNDDRLCLEQRGGPEPAFVVWARYNIANYRFLQGYTFDSRGVIEPFLRLGGQLADGDAGADGVEHFHHVYWRLDLDLSAADGAEAYVRSANGVRVVGDELERNRPPCVPWSGAGGVECTTVDVSDLPAACQTFAAEGRHGWCPIPDERQLIGHQPLHPRWRVATRNQTNELGHAMSYEIALRPEGTAPNNRTSFDVMVLQDKGDSYELGYEVPTRPFDGDHALGGYLTPGELVNDPVLWVVAHAYHDTRDEERVSMPYHDVGFSISPRDFLTANPGEDTFDVFALPIGFPPLPTRSIPCAVAGC